MLLGWIDRPRGSLGCMEETFLVFLIPNSRYLFFVFLFFDFLKMVLPSMFDFIGDFYLYNFFCLLQFRIIREVSGQLIIPLTLHVFVFYNLSGSRAHDASEESQEVQCCSILPPVPTIFSHLELTVNQNLVQLCKIM